MAEKSQKTNNNNTKGVKNITKSRFYDNVGIGREQIRHCESSDEDEEHILHDKHILKNHKNSKRDNELFNG
jgi:hypothetical protein